MDNLIADLLREIIDWGAWGGPTLIVDTETWDADTGQVMRLGVAQLRGLEYRELHDFKEREGRWPNRDELDRQRANYIFYDPNKLEKDAGQRTASIALLQSYVATRNGGLKPGEAPFELLTREKFIKRILFRKHPADKPRLPLLVIGLNLQFDIGRISTGDGLSEKEMYGGITYSFNLGKLQLPAIRIKKLGPGKSMYKVSAAKGEDATSLRFLDVATLAKALLGAGQSTSMNGLCRVFKLGEKEEIEHFQKLTWDYIDYSVNDTCVRTWSIYTALRALFERHNLHNSPDPTAIDRIYSEASLGKGYFKAIGITPFLKGNVLEPPPDRPGHAHDMLPICGVAMETMYGGRAEGRMEKEIWEGRLSDFRSQYPSSNFLLGLQRLLPGAR